MIHEFIALDMLRNTPLTMVPSTCHLVNSYVSTVSKIWNKQKHSENWKTLFTLCYELEYSFYCSRTNEIRKGISHGLECLASL